ncbi:MAG: SIS domain-containing protein [Sphaerochaetaceae bacterium]
MNTDVIKAAKEAFSIEADALLHAVTHIPDEIFFQAVHMLADVERIASSGCGHSGIACQHFSHLMCCIELPSRFISPAEALHGAMGFVQKGDVMVFGSRGGKTSELLPILDICHRKEVKVITVTENLSSPLALGADVVIPMMITQEVDKYNMQGTTSFTVLSVIFDALQAALIEYTNYQPESFAIVHPGGAVGERLNKK